MYSVLDFARMSADATRTDAYARAIARVVKPDQVVVDIGAGTGILSFLATKAGAKRVHAIDPNPAIFLLRDLARENGVSDRIVVHPVSSLEVELPERADVVVSDLRGAFPLYGDHLRAILDARARFLRPGGTLVGERDRVFVAFVESVAMWRRIETAWRAFERRGFLGSAARASVLNEVQADTRAPLASSDVLSTPAMWLDLDYTTDEDVFEATIDTTFLRGGTAHGLAVWFDAKLHDDISFSTEPGSTLCYARPFLPLLEPVDVEAGDRARVTLRVDARGTRWAWDSVLETRAGPREFRQTSFLGTPTDPTTLLRSSMTYRPSRSPRAELLMRLLEDMDGERPVEDLADRARGRLPERSPLHATLLDEVRSAVTRYGR